MFDDEHALPVVDHVVPALACRAGGACRDVVRAAWRLSTRASSRASVLTAYADRYLDYPNKDNVLGPTRVFFSTYLESIWLLQLVVALDLLETADGTASSALGATVRDRLVEPSAKLIAGYDEGLSNRQVWNNAALLAASRVLGGRVDEVALHGPSGLVRHLKEGLLADGTWYEGENYHLFAHRGLWYGVTIATAAGVRLDTALVARFNEAFATPFAHRAARFYVPVASRLAVPGVAAAVALRRARRAWRR